MAVGIPPEGYVGFEQYTLTPANLVGKIPCSLDYDEAASIPAGYATAAIGLLAKSPAGAGLNPTCALDGVSFAGQPAFVFGGSSSVGQFGQCGVGSAAIQILRTLRFSPIITYASGKHTEFLKSLGATHVIDRGAVHTADIPAAEACFELVSAGGTVVAVLQQTREYRDVDGKKLNVHGEFGVLMWRLLAKQLEEGIIRPNRIEKLPNGLAGIVDGSKRMENMAVSGVKLVAFPQETA